MDQPTLAALLDAIERLSAAREVEDIASVVRQAARRLARADGVSVVLREGDVCYYFDEEAIGPLWKGRRFPVSACLSGWCMVNRQTAVIPDVYQDDRVPHDAYRPTFVKSVVMVPVGAEEPMAAIGVYWAEPGAPEPGIVTLLEALAARPATALASAAQNKSLLTRLDELTALYQFTDRLYRTEDVSEVDEAALDAITKALHCGRASILLFDEAGVMRFVAWRGLSEAYRKAVEGHSPWRPGEHDPRPIVIDDIDTADASDDLKAAVEGEGIRALAVVPLMARRAVIGKFMAYHHASHVFTPHEIEVAVTLARQLGFGLERVRADKERAAVEEELRRNEERLRLATQIGKIGLWTWDIASGQVSWTDSLYSIHGVDKETFKPSLDGFASLVHRTTGNGSRKPSIGR